MRGIKIDDKPPADWIAKADAVTAQLLAAEATTVRNGAYTLVLLPTLSKPSDLPVVGTSLLVIGNVDGRIHVRVFDANSQLLADAGQPKRDHANSRYKHLADLLENNWDHAKLNSFVGNEIFRIAEEIIRRQLTRIIIDTNDKLWTDDRVRNWLLAKFHNKCWYTEAQDTVSAGHVDHFRPKSQVTDELTKQVSDGYWWLAFDWRNYRISGALPNSKKSDVFPCYNKTRATYNDPNSIENECPILLDPAREEEARLVSYDLQDEETCVAVPAGDISNEEVERVTRTIDILGLNTLPKLNCKRAAFWSRCRMAIAKYRGANGSSNLARITKTMAKTEIKEMVKYEAEFSSVVEACVRKNAPEPLIAAVFSH